MRHNEHQNEEGNQLSHRIGTLFSPTNRVGENVRICEKKQLHLDHQIELFSFLAAKTDAHIKYLQSVGLAERAKGINFSWFNRDELVGKTVDISTFKYQQAIPNVVETFNPHLKNTIITTDIEVSTNKQEDLDRILDIRVYPALREMIRNHKLNVFLGSKAEMVGHYENVGSNILFQFSIPSSATYYLAETKDHDYEVIMAGLVGRDNMIAQLLTLKLAEIDLRNIEIIGDFRHYQDLINKDMRELTSKITDLTSGEHHPLIVAGCGLEQMVCDILLYKYEDILDTPTRFEGDILSLIYIPLSRSNSQRGIISLNLNYGEITEHIVSSFLSQFNCKHVFTGSAGGYLPTVSEDSRPEIGSRITITRCMNEDQAISDLGNAAMFPDDLAQTHLQVPSIFLETYDWLEQAKTRGRSVDIETFYIVKAIQDFNNRKPEHMVKGDCGYFVSDYVGEKPLREYSKVFVNYADTLERFIDAALELNLTQKNKL